MVYGFIYEAAELWRRLSIAERVHSKKRYSRSRLNVQSMGLESA
jgi:hypothetical protein